MCFETTEYVIKNQDTKTSIMVNFHVDEEVLHEKMDKGESINTLKNICGFSF